MERNIRISVLGFKQLQAFCKTENLPFPRFHSNVSKICCLLHNSLYLVISIQGPSSFQHMKGELFITFFITFFAENAQVNALWRKVDAGQAD